MNNKFMIKSSMLIMALTLLNKLLGFFRELLIANNYGAGYISDVYFFVFGITGMLLLSVGEAISTTIVPLYSQINNKKETINNDFINNILNIVLVLSFLITIICIIFSEGIVKILGPGFYQSSNFNEVVCSMRIGLISILFVSMQYVFIAILQYYNRFYIISSAPFMYNIFTILCIIFFGKTMSVYGLIAIVTIAYIIQYVYIYIYIKKIGFKYKFIINLNNSYIKDFLFLVGPIILGTTVNQIGLLVDKIMANSMGEGSLSVLSYSSKLNIIFYTTIGYALSTVVFNKLVECAKEQDLDGINESLNNTVIYILIIAMPIVLFLAHYRTEIISVLFERGNFTYDDVLKTSEVFLFYSPLLILYCIKDILNKCFYSIKNTKVPTRNSIVTVILNIILNVIFTPMIGLKGIALATTIATLITIILAVLELKKMKILKFEKHIYSYIKIIIISILLANILYKFNNKIYFNTNSKKILHLGISFIKYIAIYLILIILFRVKEIKLKDRNRIIKNKGYKFWR